MQTALMNLIRTLAIVGYDSEKIEVRKPTAEEFADKYTSADTFVFIRCLPTGSQIRIMISDFWRYPGVPCYFVNFNHTNGNFMAGMGTPHIEQVMLDLGAALQMIPPVEG